MELIEIQQLASQCLQQAKYHKAIILYQQLLEKDTNDINNYWQLGLAYLLAGEVLEAQGVLLSALTSGNLDEIASKNNNLIFYLKNAASHYFQENKLEIAEIICWQILDIAPDDNDTYIYITNILINQNRLEEALVYSQQAININPNYAINYNILGVIYAKMENLETAIKYYQQAINIDTNLVIAYKNIAAAFDRQDEMEKAIFYYEKTINLEPNIAENYNNLGIALKKQGKLTEAIKFYQQAIAIDNNYALAYNNLGCVYEKQGDLAKAESYYRKAITLDPDLVVASNNLCLVLATIGDFKGAIDFYNQALEINPDSAISHFNLSILLLMQGDFQRGFAEYEWRWRHYTPRVFSQPLWDGSNLAGYTILLYAEQGLGDTIQFLRYVPLVKQCGGKVMFECPESLYRLLINFNGIDTLIKQGEDLPYFDVQLPLLSLPHILGTNLENIPAKIPYLNIKEYHNFCLDIPLDTKLKVGIVWAGSPQNPSNDRRSCSLSYFTEMLKIPGIAFYSLQKEPQVKEIQEFTDRILIQDLSDRLNDFADTAIIISQLDLIISVDTAVVHLAGALGKPVWLLLSFVPDWRWMLDREDTPWYPTMRLFRQKRLGDWTEVFSRVTELLRSLI